MVDVLVVDDAKQVRARLCAMVADVPGIGSIREAGTLVQARRLLAERPPAVVILDLRLRAESGLEFLRELKQNLPGICVVVLTNEAGEHHRRSCVALGADYFFDKSTEFEAVLPVLEGEVAERAP